MSALPSDLAIRAQTDRILASRQFSRSRSLSRFLRFVVDEALAGRSEELKEYTIGAQVFDRGDQFDPRLDSIVRVQAGKVRQRLDGYYREAGSRDPVRIELPLGQYAPVFHLPEEPAPPVDTITLAVLPLLNLSGDPDFEYFTDGLSEELVSHLGRLPNIHVIARTSSFAFKDKSVSLSEIGKALGASLLLEGSIQKQEDDIRVTARLADAVSSHPIWSRRFDGAITDIFTVQDQIAADIARAVHGTDRIRPKPHPADLDSYLLLLKAWRLWHSNDPAHLQQAVGYFERAVQTDPTNFEAHAGLAMAWTILAVFYVLPGKLAVDRASQAAHAAVEHGPDSAEAWGALGAVQATLLWDWARSEASFNKAVEINPNHALSRHAYAISLLVSLGRFDEAIREMQIVLRLDPLSILANCDLAAAYAYAGRYEEAFRQYDSTLEIEPGNPRAVVEKGWAMLCAGHVADGLDLIESVRQVIPPGFLGMYALGLALAGRRQECLGALDAMRKVMPDGHLVTNVAIAALDIAGCREAALSQLEAAYDRRDPHLRYLNIDQHLVRLRDEPRFQAVVRKMGLPPPPRRRSAQSR